jgi:hypothetical protein
MREHPEWFDFFERMEERYGNFKPETQPNRPLLSKFFRKNRSVEDIRREANKSLPLMELLGHDFSGGCGESCEAFSSATDEG